MHSPWAKLWFESSYIWMGLKGYLDKTRILCRATKVVSYNLNWSLSNLSCTTKFCVVQQNFVSYNKILCRTTKFCVIQQYSVSYNNILCRTTKFCVVQQYSVSYNKILCRTTKFSVVWHKNHASCKQTLTKEFFQSRLCKICPQELPVGASLNLRFTIC
jgi:hypothetical protein